MRTSYLRKFVAFANFPLCRISFCTIIFTSGPDRLYKSQIRNYKSLVRIILDFKYDPKIYLDKYTTKNSDLYISVVARFWKSQLLCYTTRHNLSLTVVMWEVTMGQIAAIFHVQMWCILHVVHVSNKRASGTKATRNDVVEKRNIHYS